MADLKISELTLQANPIASDQLVIERGGVSNFRVPVSDLRDTMNELGLVSQVGIGVPVASGTVPVFVSDASGRIINGTDVIITPGGGAISGITTLVASGDVSVGELAAGNVTTGTSVGVPIHANSAAGCMMEAESDGTNNAGFRMTNTTSSWQINVNSATQFQIAEVGGAAFFKAVSGAALNSIVINAASVGMAVPLILGAGGTIRGALDCNEGAGGNTAGYVRLSSRNGTDQYLWVEDDGTLKLSNAAPVNNADGVVVGAQT